MNKKNKGLTLVEVVVALLLFSIVVVFTLPVFLSANRLNNHADISHNAQDIGQEVMELVLQRASYISKESYFNNPQDLYREDFFASDANPNPPQSLLDGFASISDPDITDAYQGESLIGNIIHHQHDYEVVVESMFPLPNCNPDVLLECFSSELVVYVYQNGSLFYQAKDWLTYER